MTTITVTAYAHPSATDEQVRDLLWSKAAVAAARSGREPDAMTAHDARPTDDLVEHRADFTFTCKEIR